MARRTVDLNVNGGDVNSPKSVTAAVQMRNPSKF